jgi:MFS family permease
MGRALLGAILGAAIGLLIGWLPHWEGTWQGYQGSAQFSLPLDRLLQPLSMMIGTAAGAIVGSVVGRTAADPNSIPLPRWVGIAALILVLAVLAFGALGSVVYFFQSDAPAPRNDHQQHRKDNEQDIDPRHRPQQDPK